MELAFGIILGLSIGGVVLLFRIDKKVDSLQQSVSLIHDRALADRIINAERLKSAKERVRLRQREGKDICLTPWCRKPVFGKQIFGHCEEHLDPAERKWADEEVETKGWGEIHKDTHPAMRIAMEAQRRSDEVQFVENPRKLWDAYNDALRLKEADLVRWKESSEFLPPALLRRIIAAEKSQEVAVGWQMDN